MGSCWIDPNDSNSYPVSQPDIPPFDPSQVSLVRSFPPIKWGADFEALLGLADFACTDWKKLIILPPPPVADSPVVQQEIQTLVSLASKRAQYLSEILAQDQSFQLYLVGYMMISRRSHPRTYLVLKIAARVGEMLMVHYKMHYSRPRPVQLYPWLFPPCDTADHASYPSGHSLIAHLIAFAGAEVVPYMRDSLARLAHRIGRNREIAGFHYPTDTQAGREVAAQAMKVLKATQYFQDVLADARKEWLVVPTLPVIPQSVPVAGRPRIEQTVTVTNTDSVTLWVTVWDRNLSSGTHPVMNGEPLDGGKNDTISLRPDATGTCNVAWIVQDATGGTIGCSNGQTVSGSGLSVQRGLTANCPFS
jgi:membrane-associated phospholipid phosphatase